MMQQTIDMLREIAKEAEDILQKISIYSRFFHKSYSILIQNAAREADKRINYILCALGEIEKDLSCQPISIDRFGAVSCSKCSGLLREDDVYCSGCGRKIKWEVLL